MISNKNFQNHMQLFSIILIQFTEQRGGHLKFTTDWYNFTNSIVYLTKIIIFNPQLSTLLNYV